MLNKSRCFSLLTPVYRGLSFRPKKGTEEMFFFSPGTTSLYQGNGNKGVVDILACLGLSEGLDFVLSDLAH